MKSEVQEIKIDSNSLKTKYYTYKDNYIYLEDFEEALNKGETKIESYDNCGFVGHTLLKDLDIEYIKKIYKYQKKIKKWNIKTKI